MTPHCSTCSYGNIFISYTEVHTYTRGAGGKPGYFISWHINTDPGTFPGSESQAGLKELGTRSGQLAPCLSGRRWVNSRPPTSPLRDLLESSFVVVDCFNVTALVFQKIGIVVVHLGIVGQGLHSWAVKRNRSRTLLAARLLHLPQGRPSSHSPSLLKSLLIIRAPCHLLCICANTSHYNSELVPSAKSPRQTWICGSNSTHPGHCHRMHFQQQHCNTPCGQMLLYFKIWITKLEDQNLNV